MKGTLYGVGVGPGDPQLLTLKAVKVISESPVIAVPAGSREDAAAYQIAAGAVAGLDQKPCLALSIPMSGDPGAAEKAYRRAAAEIAELLDRGQSVAYLTLGDPSIYSTYIYIHRLVTAGGYEAELISGVPSFCAAGAALGDSLGDRQEQIHIIPSPDELEDALKLPGTKILMKAASRMPAAKQLLQERGACAAMVEKCGMKGQRIFRGAEEIPDQASYFSLTVIKEKGGGLPWDAKKGGD